MKFFPQTQQKTDQTKQTTASHVTVITNKAQESPGMPSLTDIKGALQINEVNLQSSFITSSSVILRAVNRGFLKISLEN